MSDQEEIRPSVDQFFDALTDEYAAAIERCFPRYREMFWALLDYLPPRLGASRILELGSGTGNLTVLVAERYPQATLKAVDVSAESLEVCRGRLDGSAQVEYLTTDFRDLRFDPGSFDLVISSIAVHHLTSPEKRTLFGNIYGWLSDCGVFAYADQHAGATDDLNRRHIENWKSAAMGAGSSSQEWDMWMSHQSAHDHHDTLGEQMAWLTDAGFTAVDCPWRYLLWTVIQARKPAASEAG